MPLLRFDLATLVCSQIEQAEACRLPEGSCCCGGYTTVTKMTTVVDPIKCGGCTGLDEALCRTMPNCFVAREAERDQYLDCYVQTARGSDSTPCGMRTTVEDCVQTAECAAVYASTGSGSWQYVACEDL